MKATRAELKSRAKQTLKEAYWYSFGVNMLYAILGSILSSIILLFSKTFSDVSYTAAAGLFFILELATIFVIWPIAVGLIRYYINISKGKEPQVEDLFYIFKHGYGNVVLTVFKESIFIALWSLLFVIPGIIKSYQYFMIDYMIAENPRISRKRAFEITKAVMRGNKWRTFVLGLSFILWMLLGTVTSGLGMLFLAPYIQTTFAHYYLELKARAQEAGIIAEGELDDSEPVIINN